MDMLSATTYVHHIVDGEAGAVVSCKVIQGSNGFSFEGELSQGGRSVTIRNGILGVGPVTADMTFVDSQALATLLSSPAADPCIIEVASHDLYITPGSVRARFACNSIEHPPSGYCKAGGYFALENCAQE